MIILAISSRWALTHICIHSLSVSPLFVQFDFRGLSHTTRLDPDTNGSTNWWKCPINAAICEPRRSGSVDLLTGRYHTPETFIHLAKFINVCEDWIRYLLWKIQLTTHEPRNLTRGSTKLATHPARDLWSQNLDKWQYELLKALVDWIQTHLTFI